MSPSVRLRFFSGTQLMLYSRPFLMRFMRMSLRFPVNGILKASRPLTVLLQGDLFGLRLRFIDFDLIRRFYRVARLLCQFSQIGTCASRVKQVPVELQS